VRGIALAAVLAVAVIVLPGSEDPHQGDEAWLAARPYPAVPIGAGHAFQPPPVAGPRATCRTGRRARHLAHVELFAHGRVVLIPAGLGVGGPWRTQRGRMVGARCRQTLSTVDPSGVILVGGRREQRLGELFALWGRALTPRSMLSFRGPVRAYVAGRRWVGDPRAIPLGPDAQIVLEVGRFIRPHPTYLFPRVLGAYPSRPARRSEARSAWVPRPAAPEATATKRTRPPLVPYT